ncbi:pyridoxal phosphate-dependent aminotransferase [Sphaerisporangium sp. NPDC051017]|uniref:pyridoxal phosphate-dependent aminotransferase n=1 Tax=Sphaerisporangium sp. NPDC051017 TaxID=3154636 RepID=UPI00342E4F54
MPIPFREVIAAPDLPTGFTDVAMMHRYLDAGSPAGDIIYLGFGETWTNVAPGLAAALATPLPSHSHGYVISQYGLPRLQRILRSYISATHRLPSGIEAGRDYEVAATSGGTRNTMFDFLRMLRNDPTVGAVDRPDQTPVLVAPLPGWGYAGIADSLGYRTRFLPLRDDEGCQPSLEAFDELLDSVMADPRHKLAVVVINAQHSPTAINWPADTVRHLIRRTLHAGAAVLIDDAYYAVHDPGLTPTSALRLLLEELEHAPPAARRRWLAVRSLGKQFHCNGWGLGAATADPATLDTLLNTIQLHRGFAAAVPLQEAMGTWLENPEAQHYLDHMNQQYAAKRAAIGEFIRRNLAYPPDACQLGECTAFLRMKIPFPGPRDGESLEAFREECLNRTGVLLGIDRWATDPSGAAAQEPANFRVFLGPPQEVLIEALARLAAAGYSYQP